MRTNPTYIRVYILWMNLFFQIVIPFLVLIGLNTFIYKKIKGFEKRSRENSTNFRVAFTTRKCPQGNVTPIESPSKSNQPTALKDLRRRSSLPFFPNPEELIRYSSENEFQAHKHEEQDNRQSNIKPKKTKGDIRENYPHSIGSNSNDDINYQCGNNRSVIHKPITNGKKICSSTSKRKIPDVRNETRIKTKNNTLKSGLIFESQVTITENSGSNILKRDTARSISFDRQENAKNGKRGVVKSSNGISIRKREVVLAKISLYIVFVMLICHTVRLIPNTYEMVETYTQVR